ncbi:hypothetical protein [Streptomyces sp. NPDC050548]|uniref:hypothetical protein n=1 Tax=Streptomyces sp. NPDC050548 TaxID=3365629 RepID=UPI00378F0471
MDWMSPASALLGAVIGAGGTLLAQRGQWRQQLDAQDRNVRRQLYSEYLSTLHGAGERLHQLAARVKTPESDTMLEAAHDAFGADALYSVRAQLVISAPVPVAEQVRKSMIAMRDLRDCIGRGNLIETEEYATAQRAVRDSQQHLRDAMRADLAGRRQAL